MQIKKSVDQKSCRSVEKINLLFLRPPCRCTSTPHTSVNFTELFGLIAPTLTKAIVNFIPSRMILHYFTTTRKNTFRAHSHSMHFYFNSAEDRKTKNEHRLNPVYHLLPLVPSQSSADAKKTSVDESKSLSWSKTAANDADGAPPTSNMFFQKGVDEHPTIG